MTFREHIQQCEQCRSNPFGMCQAGSRLLLLGDDIPVQVPVRAAKTLNHPVEVQDEDCGSLNRECNSPDRNQITAEFGTN